MALALDPGTGVDVALDAVGRATRAGADAAKVIHRYRQEFEVNFNTDDVTLVRSTVSDDLSITVFSDGRRGSTDLTGRAHDAVDAAVKQALQAARAGQPDAANDLPTEPAEAAISGGDEEPDREAMVDTVLRHIKVVKDAYPSIRTDSSTYTFACTWSSYANSHGRVQHARRGRYGVSLTVTAKDGERTTSFNYTSAVSDSPFSELATPPPFQRLLEDTVASFDPCPVPSTFVGDVVFTPEAVATLVGTVVQSLAGLTLVRKTTPYLDRLGEVVAAPEFTLTHQPSTLPGAAPFDGEGFVNRDLPIITNGVLDNFIVDWYSAQKLGRPMTTGSIDIAVSPGTTPLDELIGSIDRGILLGRYSGGMPSPALDFSGVAKNSFYVEGGKIVGPISETMVAGNFRGALEQIKAVSRETIDFGSYRAPWITAGGITISTK